MTSRKVSLSLGAAQKNAMNGQPCLLSHDLDGSQTLTLSNQVINPQD